MRKVPLFAAYLAANVPLVVAIFVFLPYHTFLWGAMGWGAVAAVVVGTVKHKPKRRLAWVLVAIALGCFISGDITYDILTKYLHENNPFPSLADVFYLLTYPLFASGLVSMVRARRAERDLGALIDAVTVTAAAALLSWIYLIQPYVHASSMSLLQKVVAIEYPLGDILIMCVLARLLFAGQLRPVIGLLSLGGVGLLTADCVYGWIQLHGNWRVGGPTDLGWVAFYVLWGAAALHPSMRELTERQPPRSRQVGFASLTALSLATLIAPVLLVWRAVFNDKVNDGAVIGSVAGLMFLLVMARLTGLARRQAELARGEQTLRGIGERLVVATDLDDVFSTAVDAVRTVAGQRTIVCLATEGFSGREVVVASYPAQMKGSSVDVVELAGPPSSVAVSLDGGGPVPGCGPTARWLCLSLTDRGGPHRRLLVAYTAPLSDGTLRVLEALASQSMLAMGRAELARALHRGVEEARFRSLVQNASEVILVMQADGRLSTETPSVQAILGYTPAAIASLTIEDLLHPDAAAPAAALVESMRIGGRAGVLRTEWRVGHADGRWLDMEVIANDLSNDPHIAGVVLTLRDVSERKRLEGELRHQAFHDTLTDLANRELFNDRVGNALGRLDRSGSTVSVLILDLDDFKLINDTFGHVAGDELLVAVATRLRECLRDGDTAGRLGGDEFAVCAEYSSSKAGDGAQLLAERLLETLKEPFCVAGTQITTGASIGVSVAGSRPMGAVDMLREADLALYAAKGAGKQTYRFFEPCLQEAANDRLAGRAALEAAIANEELRLHFQPIVELGGGHIIGAEALVRWERPQRGLVPPMEFIPLAEETGLVVPLGAWVLDRACAQLGQWLARYPQRGGFKMSVNVSPRQLHSTNFVETVDAILAKHGVPPTALTLEITENVLVQDDQDVRNCLVSLHDRGITIALDDFGTGYSALSYLQRFPLKTLKIDRAFVAVMDGANGRALIDAIIAMAHSLGLDVIAEGIELGQQADDLEGLGCQYGQGYLFSRPVPAPVLEAMLHEGQPLGPAKELVR